MKWSLQLSQVVDKFALPRRTPACRRGRGLLSLAGDRGNGRLREVVRGQKWSYSKWQSQGVKVTIPWFQFRDKWTGNWVTSPRLFHGLVSHTSAFSAAANAAFQRWRHEFSHWEKQGLGSEATKKWKFADPNGNVMARGVECKNGDIDMVIIYIVLNHNNFIIIPTNQSTLPNKRLQDNSIRVKLLFGGMVHFRCLTKMR
jgi:hypothetical protein